VGSSIAESAAGFLLVFFLPGFGVSRALFPEWRFRGPLGLTRIVETLALSVVTSVALTILFGFGMLVTAGGFAATWADPQLEIRLAIVAGATLFIAAYRGAFSRHVPAPRPPEPSPGDDGGWELIRRMEQLARQERSLTHALRRAGADDPHARRVTRELEEVRAEQASIRRSREVEYAE
jgi:hypothetical protein